MKQQIKVFLDKENNEVNGKLVIITKVSNDYWYEFRVISSIEDLLKIYPRTIVRPNYYDEDAVKYWDNFKKEDISKLKKAKVEVIIYDDYIE